MFAEHMLQFFSSEQRAARRHEDRVGPRGQREQERLPCSSVQSRSERDDPRRSGDHARSDGAVLGGLALEELVERIETGDDLMTTEERSAVREEAGDEEMTNEDFFWDM